MALTDLITAAETALANAKALPETDTTRQQKIDAAQGHLNGLRAAEAAGYTRTAQDESTTVQQRVGETKESERKALAQALGVEVEKLDDEIARINNDRRSGESEAQRLQREIAAKDTTITTLETEKQRHERIGQTAKTQVENLLRRQALESELRSRGVVHEVGDDGKVVSSYMDLAVEQAERLGDIKVPVEVDDEGNVKVTGAVTGAAEAADKVKEKIPVYFGETLEAPHRTPGPRDKDKKIPAYTPNLAVTGPKQGT